MALGALFLCIAIATTAGAARADEPAPAPPMSEPARAHYDRGLALYTAKDYAGAIRELEAGYAIDPRREFLFAEAQARRLDGDCKSAVPLYRKFLASDPEEVQGNAAHIALGRCAEQMASAPPRPSDAAAAPAPAAPHPPAASAPWYQDIAGAALLGAGVVGLGIGTGFTVAALSARDDANRSAQSYPDYLRLWDQAQSRSHIAVAGFAAGAVLASAGIVRYLRVRPRHTGAAATPTVEAWISPNGGGQRAIAGALAVLGGRF